MAGITLAILRIFENASRSITTGETVQKRAAVHGSYSMLRNSPAVLKPPGANGE
jgi:hypothetical protein